MIKLIIASGVILSLVSAATASANTVETRYQEVRQVLENFEKNLSLRERRDMNRVVWKERMSLSPSLRAKYLRWHQLLEEREKWAKAVELKETLIGLYDVASKRTKAVKSEADRISREVIQIFYQYRTEWGMLNSALFHNLLVNMKVKDKGFCWHWVEKFLETLRPLELKHFDFHWGVAYEGNFRENNALVIARRGEVFDSGLAIDAWRSSGRPFWRLVKKDRFPWGKRDESKLKIGEFDEAKAN